MTRLIALVMLSGMLLEAQVYSPIVTKAGQVDTSTLPNLVRDIYKESKAVTPAQKAEAIWRFFLTDGRFVKPGAIYHIAGWAYEEPKGEVLDPLKLLNSYGFGLCYHIAPLLEAVFEAGGFEDARVWFLTGHTVAEVFYDGRYHYYDSDMLGYNNTGAGVASVRQIEQDGRIVTEQLRRKDHGEPWYPADVRANAIDELAGLFTTTKDNWVYPFQRYESGHTMDFVLRPGERMTRYFHPANDRLFYLPFAQQPDGEWTQFPKEIAQYSIRTANGPRSQKDSRLWGTGRLEYDPSELRKDGIIPVASPYVIIDSEFSMRVVAESGGSVSVATSIDSGKTWTAAGEVKGPYDALWRVTPAVLTKGANGSRTAVSGVYAYQVRIQTRSAEVRDVHLATDFALNPRTLPQLTPGHNELNVRTSNLQRQVIPVEMSRLENAVSDASYVVDGGQGYLRNNNPGSKPGTVVFPLPSGELAGFDVGARFLDLRDGL
ncbi:MAG: hypothetical protein JST65_22290, partial [Acidobacteria bacterium]|nr:hypothetical protein [Acidobacteriota bacterium]